MYVVKLNIIIKKKKQKKNERTHGQSDLFHCYHACWLYLWTNHLKSLLIDFFLKEDVKLKKHMCEPENKETK